MSSKTSDMTQIEKVLEFVEISGAVMEKTANMIATKEAQDQKINKLIPIAVQALLENERIEPSEKEAAAKILRDPVNVLEVLIKTAAHRNISERTKLGNPVNDKLGKQASSEYNSLKDNYVGRRSRPDESESYKAFRRGLLGA